MRTCSVSGLSTSSFVPPFARRLPCDGGYRMSLNLICQVSATYLCVQQEEGV